MKCSCNVEVTNNKKSLANEWTQKAPTQTNYTQSPKLVQNLSYIITNYFCGRRLSLGLLMYTLTIVNVAFVKHLSCFDG